MKLWKYVWCFGMLATAWQAAVLPAAAAEHGDESGANPLTVDPDLAIFTAVVFILLLAFLSKFAWRPLMDGLERRERSINDLIEQSKRDNEQAAARLQDYEARLAAVSAEAEQLLGQARREATAAGEQLLAEARAEGDRERLRALEDIAAAKNQAVEQIAQQSADLAFLLARKLIQRELKPEDHAALVRETLEQFPSQN